ncbi:MULTISPECIES: hypothetical protein [Streptomyces]|uniref:Transmembrane protein n=2 Tax=Streptomyces TaxID=1883 RepID=A0ABV9ITT7_9ACTN
MRLRGVLLALFLLPLLWGVISLLRGGASYGIPDCDGLLRSDREEPHDMRPGDTCELSYSDERNGSAGTATYQQLKYAQELERGSLYRQGTLFTLYGAAGIGVVTAATWKRKPAA